MHCCRRHRPTYRCFVSFDFVYLTFAAMVVYFCAYAGIQREQKKLAEERILLYDNGKCVLIVCYILN